VGDILEIKDYQNIPCDCLIMTSNEARAEDRRQSSRKGKNKEIEMQSTRCFLNSK